MGKWAKYNKEFQEKWKKDPLFSKWVEEVKGDRTKARCKICHCDIRAHTADLRKHSQTSKHIKSCAVVVSQSSLASAFQRCERKVTRFEIRLASFVACHSAVRVIDHLNDLINIEYPSSSASERLRIHRTKCTVLIKRVIAPSILKQQISDLKNALFSMLIDESTDVACAKHLCVCVRYYNARKGKIVSQFLGLIYVTHCTAEALYNHMKDFFKEIGIPLQNCIAIGTDGASNLCGSHHSVYTLLKQDNPNLILIKCICHSLHLVCSHASDELPSNLDYMLRETYNWFHRSALRRASYTELFKLINDGHSPLQIIPLSTTRWLARSASVKRILEQYDALKLNFQFAATEPSDKYIARELNAMYSDVTNELYFTFLKPILSDFERMNLLFQKESADHCSLLYELENFTYSVFRRILHQKHVSLDVNLDFVSIYLPIDEVDFGYEFSTLLKKKVASKEISVEKADAIIQRCYAFLKRAAKELQRRIPGNITTLKKIKNISPAVCLNHMRPPFNELPLELAPNSNLSEIENQWRQLLTQEWEHIFQGNIPSDGATFWCKAAVVKNAGGEFVFKDIAHFALTVYSLPISNAVVERVFSRVSAIKTKIRNRMGLDLLASLVRIKMNFEEQNICCCSFEPTEDMLSFSSSIYQNVESEEQWDTDDQNEF